MYFFQIVEGAELSRPYTVFFNSRVTPRLKYEDVLSSLAAAFSTPPAYHQRPDFALDIAFSISAQVAQMVLVNIVHKTK